MPVEDCLSDESSFLVILADDVVPFVESSGHLLCVGSHDEVAHDTVGLALHFGHKMSLSALIDLDLFLDLHDCFFVLNFSFFKLIDIFLVLHLLSSADHLLPDTESFINKLLIQGVRASQNEFFGKFLSFDVESPGLIAVISGCSTSCIFEPVNSLHNLLLSFELLDFTMVLVKVVPKASPCHDFGTKLSRILNTNNVLRAVDPLVESLLHHNSIDHVPDSNELI